MMNEAPGPINFTMFLTMFGEKLNGTDPEDVIRNAFACFDEEGTGELKFSVHFEWALCLQTQWLLHIIVLFFWHVTTVLIKNTFKDNYINGVS